MLCDSFDICGHMCPATQHRGSDPIDDIFISAEIKVERSGYLAFGDGPGDHRGIFADICQDSLFGGEFQKIHRLPARRLVCSNPKVVERFNKLFAQKLEEYHVPERLENYVSDLIDCSQLRMLKNMKNLII